MSGFTDAELLAVYPDIYSFAVSMSRDKTYAEDIAQEAVLRMVRRRKHYEPREIGLASWGFKIAQNFYYDQRKLLRSKIEVGVPAECAAELGPCSKDGQTARGELKDCVDFLGTCNGSGEALLMLAFGDSHEQIAQTQGIAVNTVKTRIMRTREKLDLHFGIERKRRRSGRRVSKQK